MNGRIGEVAVAIVWVAAVYLLVRPGSAAADAVKDLSGAFTAMVTAATDIAA